MRLSARLLPLALLPLGLLGSSCIAAAGIGAGAIVAHEVLSDTPHTAHVQTDVELVWPATLEALRELGATDLEVQNFPRVVEAKIYGGTAYVKVEAYDLDYTIVRLQFRKHRILDNTTAEALLQSLLDHYHTL